MTVHVPLATSFDLATYLQQDSVDEARAGLLLGMAQDLAESIVFPLPVAAKAVVLSAAARAYTNPAGVTSETVGPYSAARPTAGVYLTTAERATLRRLSGTGGAFTVDPTPPDAGSAYPAPSWWWSPDWEGSDEPG